MKKVLVPVLAFLTITFAPLAVAAQQTARTLGSTAAPYGFYEYLPLGYNAADPAQQWPLVIFLHGAGERGDGTTQLTKVLVNGPPKNIKAGTQYPFLVLSPQDVPSSAEDYNWNLAYLDELIEYAKITYNVDPDRIYLTGLSMGGRGTWQYGKAHPEKLAAVVPVCGADTSYNGAKFVDVPTWAFHAWNDGTVDVDVSINWVNRIAGARTGDVPTNVMGSYPLPVDRTRTASYDVATETWTWNEGMTQAAGSHPTLTIYPTGGHDSWTPTYDSTTWWKWFLSQTRHGALNVAPRVTITAPGASATSPVTITATVTDGDGVLDPVEFYAGSTRLGSDSSAPYQLVWNNAPAGTHWITVKATDNDNTTSAAILKLTVQANPTLRILTPAAAGKAIDGLFFPMNFAFDGQPTGLDATGKPTGGIDAEDAPGYSDRVGYIDFGANWQNVRIAQTWTKYRVSSIGNQAPYAELWWDDDIDSANDSGLTETRLNFNTAQNLSTGSTTPWIKDRDPGTASPVTPRARYLMARSAVAMTGRAKEYAFVGWTVP
jgi:poly(3-hydroxybutyrate) depolymerase